MAALHDVLMFERQHLASRIQVEIDSAMEELGLARARVARPGARVNATLLASVVEGIAELRRLDLVIEQEQKLQGGA